jgi:PPOX class probable F420-dependent enzyme
MSFPTFQKQQYLNLETFRKTGQGVKTPVWFAKEDDALYVWTQANSGKAKRIRRETPVSVNIAPCKSDGALLGEWLPARASRDNSPEAVEHVRKLMIKKYGLMFHAFALMGKFSKAAHTTLKITAE